MNHLRKTTSGIMNERDTLTRVVCPTGIVESFTSYNHEMTSHSSGDNIPDDIRREWRYGGNAYWVEMELQRRGYRCDRIRGRSR